MFEFQTSLWVAILFSTLGSIICLALLFCIILFERNQHFRTLIDQLVTSMHWYGILWIFTVQVPTTIRYFVGPFPTFLCALDVIYKNVFNMQVLFFLDFIILCRYIFIFHLKNPTSLQEDFWKIFINLFSITFCFISQIVIFLMPGKHPNIYFVCLGHYPKNMINLPTKPNYPVVFQFLFSFAFFIFASIRFKIHRNKQNANDLVQSVSVQYNQNSINFQTLENFATNVIHLFVMVMAFSSTVILNKISIDKFEVFENYALIFFQHHVLPISMFGTMMILNYAKNKPLRRFFIFEFLPDVKYALRI